ncbi:MAG: hypothetical protein LBG60_13910 [Bifidobacteriaceae bacterium]|jgi:hypothetical protein|nr:hypothetical protein [Bifidobacteriaceae bacterium]
MARPTTRDDLALAASDGAGKLLHLVDHLPAGALEAGTVEGGSPADPGRGHTWKTLPGLNRLR